MAATTETNVPFERPVRSGLTVAELFAVVVVAATFAAKVWLAVSVGLDGDEAYYAMWSAYLSPGYLDHPPGIAVMIALGQQLAGISYFGVRLVPLLSGLVVLAALYRTGRLLVPGRTAAALAVAWYCLSVQGGINFIATPDSPSTLFWMLSVWAAAEAVVGRKPSWWLAVGVFAGAGLASKYTNAWLGVGLVLYLMGSRDGRAQLLRWQVWAGGALALAVFSPVLWWNYQREWSSFLFQGLRITTVETAWGELVPEFIISQAVVMGPALLLGALLGIGGWFLGPGRKVGARLALPVLTSLPLLGYFLFHAFHARVETNWTHPVVPVLALIGAAFVCMPPSRGWVAALATTLQAVFGVAALGLAYMQAAYYPFDLGAADRTRALRGWETLSADIRRIADETGAKVIWTEGNYQLTGELFFYGDAARDPRPVRDLLAHPRYDYVPSDKRYPRETSALLVQRVDSFEEAEQLKPRPEFAATRLVTVLKRDEGAGRGREYYAVFTVSEPTDAFPRAE